MWLGLQGFTCPLGKRPAFAIQFYATERTLVSVGTFARATDRSRVPVDDSQSETTAMAARWLIPGHPALANTGRSARMMTAANPSASDAREVDRHARFGRQPHELKMSVTKHARE